MLYLLPIAPQAHRIVKAYAMPAGKRAGRILTNEIDTDTVAVFDPANEKFRVIALPSRNVGIRKAIIDAAGRCWYMGSHNGRLGRIQ